MTATTPHIDLFAGPGGFDEGMAALGIRPLGFEWDADACRTATVAGHARIMGDIAALNPSDYRDHSAGQVAGPPCQGFSPAGKGKSRDDSVHLLDALHTVRTRRDLERVIADLTPTMTDPRTLLVLEPLRWALALTPSWVVWEQVTTVLPLWDACAGVLRRIGYTVATGIVNAEQYGVPQTRRRAVLLARAPWFTAEHGPATLPTPTHSRYHSRTPERLDAGVLPWVTMAQALGDAYRDQVVVSNYGTGGDPAKRGERTTDQPSATVTGKVGRNKWVPRFNDQSGTAYDPEWPSKRPATTVAGRGLVQNPGATANRFNGSTKSRNDGVRVTVQEAAILQTFPADYPWQGTEGSQYQQVGNALPPLLARALVAHVAALPLP